MKKVKSLNFTMVLVVLFIMITSGFMTAACFVILYRLGLIPNALYTPFYMPFITLFVSMILGTLISIIVGKKILKPINDLIKAMEVVSSGDFTVQVKEPKEDMALSDLMKSFNIMVTELGSIEIFRQNFINNFSHEFKTPIVSIRGFAKQLQKDTITKEQRKEYTDIIIAESERLTNMSSNILLLTKFENQQIVSDRREFYLDEQIRKCVLLLEKQWSKKSIGLDLELEEMKYISNEEMLSNLWINLLSNAIKFSNINGEINIKCFVEEKNVIVEITDNGIGIDKNTMNHIFDKFYQGDTSHIMEGNGLGLSLVKRIVELCQGDIAVKSELGKGTTVTVRLPIEE